MRSRLAKFAKLIWGLGPSVRVLTGVICLALFFLGSDKLLAAEERFVTLVNPIRGEEFFEEARSPSLGTALQVKLHQDLSLPATWLIRFDALGAEKIKKEIDKLSDEHERGLFLEVTPGMTEVAGVEYPQGGIFWHDANKIFLSGYLPKEREKLIDTAFWKFKSVFGHYPTSVGAWHVDAFSASYMREKYGVTAVLICADQLSTDHYQIWGGWWGVPFYPSRFNIIAPAQSLRNKLDLVVFWWAARDPGLGYGPGVEESTYSVQVNDYALFHGKGANYFKELLSVYLDNPQNQFGQLTVGLENDNDWAKIGNNYQLQLKVVSEGVERGDFKLLTMSEFSRWYRREFPGLSPRHQIADWVMSPDFRAGLVEKENDNYLRDLRIYNENWPEPYLLAANPWPNLALNYPAKIDTVRFPEQLVQAPESPEEISSTRLIKAFGPQKVPFRQSRLVLIGFYLFIIISLAWRLKANKALFLLIVLGSAAWSATMVGSGLVYPYGMGFWGPNGHDGIWHLTLINQLRNFSFQNPVFAGASLANYHFGFDLLLAVISRLTLISPVRLYFQVFPPLLASAIGLLTYRLVKKWMGVGKSAWWAVFFVYFGGSWGWLLGKGESAFWANQAISTLVNPPYALSLVILLAGIIRLLDYIKKPGGKNMVICSVLFGILIQTKVYAGILVLGSLLAVCFYKVVLSQVKKENLPAQWLSLGGLSLTIATVVFLPFNLKGASLIAFSPLWFPRSMIAYPDRVGWLKLASATSTFSMAKVWPKLILAEGLALAIFLFGNLGTRAVGFIEALKPKSFKDKPSFGVFIFSFLASSLLIPLLFIQKGNPWNTIQFFYYFQFMLAILAGISLGGLNLALLKNKALVAVIVLLTLPTSFLTLKQVYLPSRPPSRISIEELAALGFLRRQPKGIVLSAPFDSHWRQIFSEPRPLYAYETTGYVSALSAQPSFLADEMNLEISGYPWRERREALVRFFGTDNKDFMNRLIRENKIKYLYLVRGQKIMLSPLEIGGEKIFENGEVSIYQFNQQ